MAIEVREVVALGLGSVAFAYKEWNRPEEALAACDRLMRRYGGDRTSRILEIASVELLNKANLLLQLNRLEEAVAVCNDIDRRFSDSDVSAVVVQVANSLALKATALGGLGRHLEAKAAWEEVIPAFWSQGRSPDLTLLLGRLFFKLPTRPENRAFSRRRRWRSTSCCTGLRKGCPDINAKRI